MSGYEYQAIDHDASIRAERPDPNGFVDQVRVTITHGEGEPSSITMWAEDFEAMAREVRRAPIGGGVLPGALAHPVTDNELDAVMLGFEPEAQRAQVATQEPAGEPGVDSAERGASGGLDGAPVTDWAKVDHTADQCQFEECPACGCCAHGKEHVIGCSTTLDRPLGTECPNTNCACKGGMG